MAKTEVQYLLAEWAKWTATGGVDIGYAHRAPFYLGREKGSRIRIDDYMAGRVDRAVASLQIRCRHDPKDMRYPALEWVYLKRRPIYQLAEKFHVERRRAASALLAAESWVDSQLFTDEMTLALVAHEML